MVKLAHGHRDRLYVNQILQIILRQGAPFTNIRVDK